MQDWCKIACHRASYSSCCKWQIGYAQSIKFFYCKLQIGGLYVRLKRERERERERVNSSTESFLQKTMSIEIKPPWFLIPSTSKLQEADCSPALSHFPWMLQFMTAHEFASSNIAAWIQLNELAASNIAARAWDERWLARTVVRITN